MSDQNQNEIKINIPGLLKMLGENLYAEPEMAVREMIQNAHDACILRGTEDPRFKSPQINVSFDRSAETLTFSDNGKGMTDEELRKHLATIGDSFTQIQREELQNKSAKEALLLIGQFGIGVLSAFSIASQVEVYTRSSKSGSSGYRWVCKSKSKNYELDPAEVPDIGTRMVLHLDDSKLALLDETHLRQAIKKYADYLSVPIYLNGKQANSCTPPWLAGAGAEEYSQHISERYNLLALAVFAFRVPSPPLDGLLFVPLSPLGITRDYGEVDVYVSRMFVTANEKSLMPIWARFIKGVINAPTLTPMLDRNELVRDDAFEQVRGTLGKFIQKSLADLAKNAPETLRQIVQVYNSTIKAQAAQYDELFDSVGNHVEMDTNRGAMSIGEYLQKSGNVIYYYADPGMGAQSSLLFDGKPYPVIDASWGAEEKFLQKYAQHTGVKLERLEADSDAIFQKSETVDEKWHQLERDFKQEVSKEAKAVAFDPDTVPAMLVPKPQEQAAPAAGDMGIDSAWIRQMIQQTADSKQLRAAGEDTILNININNPMMQQLRDMNKDETFHILLKAVFQNVLLFKQGYIAPENTEMFFNINNDVFAKAVTNTLELANVQKDAAKIERQMNDLQRKAAQIQITAYRSCFFAYPFRDEFHKLRDEIARILKEQYGIRLMTTSIEQKRANIVEDIKNQIASAHFGIADITNNNPNVLWELGLMIGYDKPVIILKDQSDQTKTPFDVQGEYRMPYRIVKDSSVGITEYSLLQKGLERNLKPIFTALPELERAAKWSG